MTTPELLTPLKLIRKQINYKTNMLMVTLGMNLTSASVVMKSQLLSHVPNTSW